MDNLCLSKDFPFCKLTTIRKEEQNVMGNHCNIVGSVGARLGEQLHSGWLDTSSAGNSRDCGCA